MGLFRTLRNAFRKVFGDGQQPESPRVTRTPTPRGTRARGTRPSPPRARVPKDALPAGWAIEGLWTQDKGLGTDKSPSDGQIERADAVVISYTDALGKDYRTIHGAHSREQVGDLIRRVVMVISPPR